MTEVERKTIKSALLRCAKEQENRPVYTGEVLPSLICKSAAERIEELETQIKKMKCCGNCKFNKFEDSDYDDENDNPCHDCYIYDNWKAFYD